MLRSNKSKPKQAASPNSAVTCRLAFNAIGTLWSIEIFNYSADDMPAIEVAIQDRIEVFDRTYSRFREDSLVTEMASKAGKYQLPDDAESLVGLYKQLYELTEGAVTPLIGQTLADAGYDATYSFVPTKITAPPAWGAAMTYDPPVLSLKQPALLDFGAAGKGYLVDIVGQILERHGIQDYCVNAGGDILYRSASDVPLPIALEHPDDPTVAVGIAHISNQSICGSSGNRRAWGAYHHIINPHSLTSPQHTRALWVIARDGLTADGLATALFFVPPEVLATNFDFEYAIINEDYSLSHSTNFPAEFYTNADQDV